MSKKAKSHSQVMPKYSKSPWKSILIYIVMGIFWIVFSDKILALFVNDYDNYVVVQSYKGIFYVFGTAIILYYVINYDYSSILALLKILEGKNKSLEVFSNELSTVNSELNNAMDTLVNQMQINEEFYSNCHTVIMIWTLNGKVLEVNDYFNQLFGYHEDEIVGEKWTEVITLKNDDGTIANRLNTLMIDYHVKNFNCKVKTKENRVLDVLWNDAVVLNREINEMVVVSFGIDVTKEKKYEEELKQMVYKDALTSLNNRLAFEVEVQNLINKNQSFTLYSIDVDNFSHINYMHGHQAGDLFLQDLAKRLEVNLHDCKLYRLYGDEFMILDNEVSSESVSSRIDQLKSVSEYIWNYRHNEYHTSTSIGITKYPEDGEKMNSILQNIDLALHYSKKNGNSKVNQYKKCFHNEMENRIFLENSIYLALEEKLFELYYQPIYELNDGGLSGLEVLLRLQLNGEMVNIGELIGVAEETSQILIIDQWVIEKSFEFISMNLVNSNILVSINLSSRTFSSIETIDYIESMTRKYNVDPSKIQFEVTEYSLINDVNNCKKVINELKDFGYKIALDDFGTKYSSLNYLSEIAFDSLKIDKSYVDKINNNEKDKIIVEEIIRLSKRLGIYTVGEGVEDNEQLDLLTDLGCDFVQGYLLAKPQNTDSIKKVILSEST